MSLESAIRRRVYGSGIARDVCRGRGPRRALVLYAVLPFRWRAHPPTHQNVGQVRELAGALDEHGYVVDVVNHDERRSGLLRHDYDLVVDLHPSATPLYRDRLRPGARRIAYITGNNPAFSNAAELRRLRELEERRGLRLRPRRQVPLFPAEALESCDAFFYFGDRTSLATFSEFRLPPAFRLFNNGYDDVEPTDPARRAPGRFLFLGGTGQVHKGLDLMLEAVAAEPRLELVVCSPFRAERDFTAAYRRELFSTPNIRAAGFVNVKSPAFRELQSGCSVLFLPSCSEVQSSNVTAALSYGIPCVVSAHCGFDDPELLVLPDCRIETLRETARGLASEPAGALRARAEASLDLFRRRYRPAHYAAALKAAMRQVLGEPPGRPGAGTPPPGSVAGVPA